MTATNIQVIDVVLPPPILNVVVCKGLALPVTAAGDADIPYKSMILIIQRRKLGKLLALPNQFDDFICFVPITLLLLPSFANTRT